MTVTVFIVTNIVLFSVLGPHVRHLDSVLALGDTQNVYGNTFKLLPTEPLPAVGYHDVKWDEVTLSV